MERGDPHRWKNRQEQKEATRQAPPTHPLLVCCRGTRGSVGIISPSKVVISRWGWRLRSVIQLDTRRLEEKDGKFKVWLDCSASSKLNLERALSQKAEDRAGARLSGAGSVVGAWLESPRERLGVWLESPIEGLGA